MKKECFSLCLTVVAAVVVGLDARAANIEFYRRSKTGGSWNDVNHWVTNAGGSVLMGTYPKDPATDRVWFKDGFTNDTQELYLESDINVLNMMQLNASAGNQTNYLNLGGHTLYVVNFLNQDYGCVGTFAITNGNISSMMIRTIGSGYCLWFKGPNTRFDLHGDWYRICIGYNSARSTLRVSDGAVCNWPCTMFYLGGEQLSGKHDGNRLVIDSGGLVTNCNTDLVINRGGGTNGLYVSDGGKFHSNAGIQMNSSDGGWHTNPVMKSVTAILDVRDGTVDIRRLTGSVGSNSVLRLAGPQSDLRIRNEMVITNTFDMTFDMTDGVFAAETAPIRLTSASHTHILGDGTIRVRYPQRFAKEHKGLIPLIHAASGNLTYTGDIRFDFTEARWAQAVTNSTMVAIKIVPPGLVFSIQ